MFLCKILEIFLFLIVVLLAATYLYERLGIGMSSAHTNNAPPAATQKELCEMYCFEYETFFNEILSPLIDDIREEIMLSRTGDVPKHLPESYDIVKYHSKYGIMFHYILYRQIDKVGGLKEKFKPTYKALELREVKKGINSNLKKYCIHKGYSPVRIVGCQDLDNGRISILIAGDANYV